jgi:MFS family permease
MSAAPGKTGYRWYALGLLLAVAVVNQVDRLALSILQVPIKQELGLSDAQLGLLTGAAFALIYTTISVPLARLADRSSRKRVLLISLVFWSVLTACCGTATSFTWLVIFRMGVAIGEAGSMPASLAMLADMFRRRERGTALGIWSLAIPLGQALGFGLSGWLASWLGWRGTFLTLGAVGLAMAPIVLFTLREPVRGAAEETPAPPAAVPPFGESIAALWRLRSLRHVLAGGALSAYAIYVALNWNAPFYSRVHALTMAELGTSLALMSLIGTTLGTVIGGVSSDRLGRRDPRWRMYIPCIGALAFAPLMVIQYFVGDARTSILVGVGTMFAAHLFYAPTVSVVQSLAPPNLRALASSLLVLSLSIVGMSAGPLVTGIISDRLVAMGMGAQSLRYALSVSSVFGVWAAFHYYRAAVLLARDLPPEPTDTVATAPVRRDAEPNRPVAAKGGASL